MGKDNSRIQTVRHKENPFLANLVVKTKGRRIDVSPIGSESSVLVNQHTGEIKGTHVTSFKQVDDAEFIKVFTANISLTFDLNQAGRKVFDMLLHVMQQQAISKDQVYLDNQTREDFVKEHKLKLASSTMYRGIDNLIQRSILAKSTRTNIYFINPAMIFNGDRIAFTTLIERRSSIERKEEQQEIPFE